MASFWSLGSYLGLTPLRSARTQLGQFSKDIFFMEKINLRYVIQCKQRLLGRPCTQKRKESMGNSVVKLWGQKGFGHLSSSLSGHLKPLVSLQPNGGFHYLDLRWLCIWNGGHGVRYIVNSEFQCFFVDTPTSSHGTNSCAGDRESWQLDWHFFQSKLSPLFSFDCSQDAPRLHQPCGRLRWRAVGTLSRFASKRWETWGILQEEIKGDIERKGNNRKEIGPKQDAQRRKNQNDKRERERAPPDMDAPFLWRQKAQRSTASPAVFVFQSDLGRWALMKDVSTAVTKRPRETAAGRRMVLGSQYQKPWPKVG